MKTTAEIPTFIQFRSSRDDDAPSHPGLDQVGRLIAIDVVVSQMRVDSWGLVVGLVRQGGAVAGCGHGLGLIIDQRGTVGVGVGRVGCIVKGRGRFISANFPSSSSESHQAGKDKLWERKKGLTSSHAASQSTHQFHHLGELVG